MAQLSDDCFAFGGELLRVDEAEQLIAARVNPLSRTETVALDDARGRGLAADLIAPVPLPTFDNSAVDGFAVRHGDVPPHFGYVQVGAPAARVEDRQRESRRKGPGPAAR